MRIDIHTHVFRAGAAQQIIDAMAARIHVKAPGTGLPEDLIARIHAAGLDRAVALYAPPKPAMIHLANSFAIDLQRQYPELIVFGSVHPHMPRWEEELDFLRNAGIKGLKLHPEYQNYSLADPQVVPLLQAAAPHFVFLCHMGGLAPDMDPATVAATPYQLARILDQIPHMRFIAAHLGGQYLWEDSLEHLAGRDVWLDTAAALHAINPATRFAILQKHDPQKIVFGSDYPFFDPATEIEELERILPSPAVERILTNASRLFDLP